MVEASSDCADLTRLRRELDYLADRGLLELRKEPGGRWFGDLHRRGDIEASGHDDRK